MANSTAKEMTSTFWKTCSTVSKKSKQKSLQCAHESYIDSIIEGRSIVNGIETEGKAHRSSMQAPDTAHLDKRQTHSGAVGLCGINIQASLFANVS